MAKFKSYLSLIKFSHTIFAMPFALIGFFLATPTEMVTGVSQWNLNKTLGWESGNNAALFLMNDKAGYAADSMLAKVVNGGNAAQLIALYLLLVILCMILARSAAMAFNRYLDRQFDARNPRTAVREIPAGVVSPRNALILTIVSSALFIVTTFFINRICFFLSPVALAIVLGYSYTKRFTPLCHLILGLGLSLAPIGAYLAVTGEFDKLPILFSAAVLCWVSGFDIIYSLQDEEFDKSQQLYSIPAWLGKGKALRVSEALHMVSVASIVYAGIYGDFGWLYWMGTFVFLGMLVYQHSIVKPHDLRKVNLAFMTANGIASVVFAIFVIADIFFSN